MENLKEKFQKWKEALESKKTNVNLDKTGWKNNHQTIR